MRVVKIKEIESLCGVIYARIRSPIRNVYNVISYIVIADANNVLNEHIIRINAPSKNR